jgi:hypothetical protein
METLAPRDGSVAIKRTPSVCFGSTFAIGDREA